LKAAGLPGSGENGEFGDTGIVSHTNQGLVSGTFVVLGVAGALLLARRRRG
ncbi:LPXTG cell wall anchor domain-containing protein, partial [Streptococcus pseudopneumoniae]|nr:LPXTG cell wall anchor domain-containing protein [Streptococcus pseudopneumoniae]